MDMLSEKYKNVREILCLSLNGLGTLEEVKNQVEDLQAYIGVFRIEQELFARFGPEVVELVQKTAPNSKIFLDLKYYHTSDELKESVRTATGLGVSMISISRSLEGVEDIKAVAKEVLAKNPKLEMPKIIELTIFTHLDIEDTFHSLNDVENIDDELIKDVQDCNFDGIVLYSENLLHISSYIKSRSDCFMLIVQGVKQKNSIRGYQKISITPEEAILNNCNLIVMGQTITMINTKEEQINFLTEIYKSAIKGFDTLNAKN